jgi:hypothetical protein
MNKLASSTHLFIVQDSQNEFGRNSFFICESGRPGVREEKLFSVNGNPIPFVSHVFTVVPCHLVWIFDQHGAAFNLVFLAIR